MDLDACMKVKSMNILFLTELLYPHGSGGELATYLWAQLLAESGRKVRVVTSSFPSEPERSERGNLEIFRLPTLGASASVKYCLLGRFDVLLSNFFRKLLAWADVVCIPRFWYSAIPVAKAYGKPVITHLHGYIPVCPVATLYDLSRNRICDSHNSCRPSCIIAHEKAHGKNFLETMGSTLLNSATWRYLRKLVELSDSVICVSKAQRDIIIAHMPSLTRKCYLIYNPLPELSEIEINGRDMGYFGGPSPLKGFNVLCSALRYVKNKVTIHATGFDPSKQGLIQFSNKSRILFYERLPQSLYEQIHKETHTVLVPSIWAEPFGYVVAEAILQGRLVIASKVGGVPEQVNGCPGVFSFESGDYRHLAELIEYVNDLSVETIRDLAAKNREVFLKRFDNKKVEQELMSVLDVVGH